MIAILLLAVFTASFVVAVPTLSYPFNSQVPPVARSGQYYNYTLPANTFASYLPDVTYSLSGNPTWLSIDSASRTLEGLPTSDDIGDPSFSLVATDSTGSATDAVVLVVSSGTGPYVAVSLESQLATMGTVDGSGGLVLKSDTAFHIAFAQNTFADTGGNVTAYYGTSDNYTPLPSWISFDVTNIAFSGTTPTIVSAIAPPQYFNFVLVGTDYPGFAGISASFQIVVGLHQLTFTTLQYSERAIVDEQFSFSLPSTTLTLDQTPISAANISFVSANTTGSWLVFDNATYVLSGTPHTTDISTDIAITAVDIFGDVATTNVLIEVGANSINNSATSVNASSTIFTLGSLPTTFHAIEGTFFSYTFNSSILPATATLNVTISNTSWLHYNSANRTLYGEVPSSSASRKRQVAGSSPSVTITASQGGQSQTQTITVTTTAPTSTNTNTSTSTTSAETTAASTSAAASQTSAATGATDKSAKSGLTTGQKVGIALGVVFFVLLLVAILVLWLTKCFRTLRRREGSIRSDSTKISRPVMTEKDDWPQPVHLNSAEDEPRQIDAFQMFKSNSEGRLSGYAVEINHSGILAPPLAPLAHELPPLPESPSFDAVRSAYSSDGNSRSTSMAVSSVSRDNTLSVNNSIANIPNSILERSTIKPIINARRSALQAEEHTRNSTQTIDTVSTDELFSVRLIGTNASGPEVAPPLTRPEFAAPARTLSTGQGNMTRYPFMTNSETQFSGRTIGTYTSSEGDYIQRYASQGESFSSGEQSRSQLAQGPQQSSQPQPWRVINSEESYDSFGSYATTDSNLSDEFSFDGSQHSDNHARHEEPVVEGEADHYSASNGIGSRVDSVVLAAPLSPDWSGTPHSSVLRRPTLNERVASFGKGRLKEFTAAKRPTSNPSFDSPDMSFGDTTGSSAEIAFV